MVVKKRDQRQRFGSATPPEGFKEDPYEVKPGLGGMKAYRPNAMAVVCIMLEVERTTYRKMVGILRNNTVMTSKIGLESVPSKST